MQFSLCIVGIHAVSQLLFIRIRFKVLWWCFDSCMCAIMCTRHIMPIVHGGCVGSHRRLLYLLNEQECAGSDPCQQCVCILSFVWFRFSCQCLHCLSLRPLAQVNYFELKSTLSLCSPGTVSESGRTPCLPCPVGTYAAKNSQTACVSCPAGQTTSQAGSQSILECVPFQCPTNSSGPDVYGAKQWI